MVFLKRFPNIELDSVHCKLGIKPKLSCTQITEQPSYQLSRTLTQMFILKTKQTEVLLSFLMQNFGPEITFKIPPEVAFTSFREQVWLSQLYPK